MNAVGNVVYDITNTGINDGSNNSEIHYNTVYECDLIPGNGASAETSNNIVATTANSGNFVDAANGDFHLVAGSVYIDAGSFNNIFDDFFDLYGIDITKDFDGVSRPQGSAFDLGAFERLL